MAYIEGKINQKRWGKQKIRSGLISHRVRPELIDQKLSEVSLLIYQENLLKLAQKKAKTLSDKASLIPKIKLEKIKYVIGKNTTSAIRAGFYHGYSGLIDNIIKMIIKQTGRSFNIILTGGYSYLFKNSIKGKTIIKKDLTINGVLKAAVLSK